jgi:hypothetical protein
MGKPTGRNGREHMSQLGNERVSNPLSAFRFRVSGFVCFPLVNFSFFLLTCALTALPPSQFSPLMETFRTVSVGRSSTLPYIASALASLRLNRRSVDVLSGVHFAPAAFAFRNLAISLSERSRPLHRKRLMMRS